MSACSFPGSLGFLSRYSFLGREKHYFGTLVGILRMMLSYSLLALASAEEVVVKKTQTLKPSLVAELQYGC